MGVREREFDVLRGIGILLMVMGHVGFGDAFSQYIHAFHMPIFFFVAGYFFSVKKYSDTWDLLKHDLRNLMLPYTIFWFLCQLLHVIYTKDFSLSYSILSYFSSNHNRIDGAGAYWFLLCLFVAKQLFYCVSKIPKSRLHLGVIIVLTLTGNVLRQFVKLPLCLDSAMSCQLLMYLGYLYRQYKAKKAEQRVWNIPLWALLLCLVLNGYLIMLNHAGRLRTNYYGIIHLYWVNSVTAIFLYLQISRKIANSERKNARAIAGAFSYIGKNSIVFLVLNELMIFFVETVLCVAGLSYSTLFWEQILVCVLSMIFLVIANEIVCRTKLRVIVGK